MYNTQNFDGSLCLKHFVSQIKGKKKMERSSNELISPLSYIASENVIIGSEHSFSCLELGLPRDLPVGLQKLSLPFDPNHQLYAQESFTIEQSHFLPEGWKRCGQYLRNIQTLNLMGVKGLWNMLTNFFHYDKNNQIWSGCEKKSL